MLANIIIDIIIAIIFIFILYFINTQNIRFFSMIKHITKLSFIRHETKELCNIVCDNCNNLIPKYNDAYEFHSNIKFNIVLCCKCYVSEHNTYK